MNKLQWNFNQNTTLFIHENASENIVCGKAAILYRVKWVKNDPNKDTVNAGLTYYRCNILRQKFHWSLFPRVQLLISQLWHQTGDKSLTKPMVTNKDQFWGDDWSHMTLLHYNELRCAIIPILPTNKLWLLYKLWSLVSSWSITVTS